ncbi:MAG: hypothetical protein KDA41_14590, partial [Planctomycetales bacterium]|nr:hypothetical protein [Planctomycetales bacterium]
AQQKSLLQDVARLLNVPPFDAPQRVHAMLEESLKMERQLADRKAAGPLSADDFLKTADEIAGTHAVVAVLPGGNANLMRQLIDQIRKKTNSSAVLLAAGEDDKVTLVAGLSNDLVAKGHSAGKWVQQAAAVVGGGGGGRPDMAQAGGKDPARLPEAVEVAKKWIAEQLS